MKSALIIFSIFALFYTLIILPIQRRLRKKNMYGLDDITKQHQKTTEQYYDDDYYSKRHIVLEEQ